VSTAKLNPQELLRYDRQIILPGFGPAGQEKLKAARILVVGLGGLGCPASLYLAAAGVGRLTLVDQEAVELSNLNRQILHHEPDLGRPKVESAAEKLRRLNSGLEISARQLTLTAENAPELVGQHDLVVDGLDNFATRRLINRACVDLGVPFIYGGIQGLTGMVSFFQPPGGPCLECIFPHDIPPQKFPVLGTTPGLIACLEATEAIKYLTGLGESLQGRLLVYDGLTARFQEVSLSRDPDCPACGRPRAGQPPSGPA